MLVQSLHRALVLDALFKTSMRINSISPFPGPTQTQLLKVSESMEKEIIEQVYYKLFDPEEELGSLMKTVA